MTQHTSAPPKPTHALLSSEPDEVSPCWTNRRRMLWLVVLFCIAVVAYVLHSELQSKVAETAVTMAFFCLGSMVGSYVFGATWQDINLKKSTRRRDVHVPPDDFPGGK